VRISNKNFLGAFLIGLLVFSSCWNHHSDYTMAGDNHLGSPHYYDGKFHNHNGLKLVSPSFWRATKAVLFEGANKIPARPLPVLRLDKKHFQNNNLGNFSFVWLGHASVLLHLEGKYFLTDPMFSERSSFTQWTGPKRFHPVPIEREDHFADSLGSFQPCNS
jgi:hypothetical protein